MKRAVLYLRVSERDQVDGYSLDVQDRLCREWCARNGYEVAEVFSEQGESAKTAERTQLRRMIDSLRRRVAGVEVVVVKDFSRFARRSEDHHVLRAVLRRLGVAVVSVTEPADDSPAGRLMEAMLAGMHQFENDLRGERVRGCMQAALSAGRWVFQAPLGYAWLPGDEKGRVIAVDPERAPLVRMAFELIAEGTCNSAEALRRVNRAGLRTRRGRPVSKQAFSDMLRLPIYYGRVVYPPWGIDVDGKHEAIVQPMVWHRAQRVLDGRAPAPASRGKRLDHPDFPLRRFVLCGACGTPLTAEWARGRSARYPYYRCRRSDCRAVRARKDDFEEEFVAFLRRLQPTRGYMELLRLIVVDVWSGERTAARDEARRQQRRAAELRERKDRLVEAYLFERSIDRDTYERLLAGITVDLADAEMASEEARGEEIDVDALLDYAIAVLTRADRLWREAAPEIQRRFERALFPGGVEYVPGTGFRTGATSLLFEPLPREQAPGVGMVGASGLEPLTSTV